MTNRASDTSNKRTGTAEAPWILGLVGFYCLAVYLYLVVGFRPTAHGYYWQLLDFELLRENLTEALFFLHAQPPLKNLVVGWVLKVAAATGWPPEIMAQFPLQLCGLSSMVGTYLLARLLRMGRISASLVSMFLVLSPEFPLFVFVIFYTLPLQALLVGTVLAAGRFLRTGSRRAAMVVAGLLLSVSWTRSMFPPLFALLFWGATLRLSHRLGPRPLFRGWRSLTLALVLGLVIWPTKNWFVFGHFTSTSWDGYNLTRGVPLAPSARALEDYLFRRTSKFPGREAACREFTARWKGWDARAVLSPDKVSWGPNWNDIAHLQSREELLHHAWRWRAENPWQAFVNVLTNCRLWANATTDLGWIVMPGYPNKLPISKSWMAWERGYKRLFFRDAKGPLQAVCSALFSGVSEPNQGFILRWILRENDPFPLFGVLWVLMVVWHCGDLLRLRDSWQPEDGVRILALGVLLWSLAIPVLTDCFEGSRMRMTTHSLFLVMALFPLAVGCRRAEVR